MTIYVYETFDLSTGLIMAELPLSCSALPETLNTFDTASFEMQVSDTTKLPKGWQYSITPGRTGVIALADGVKTVWCGVIWSIDTSQNGQAIKLSCTTLAGFYQYQTLDADQSFTATDQHTIARAMGQYVDTQPGGNIGVNWGTDLSGVLRDRNEYFGSEHKSIIDIWIGLAGVINGIDFRFRTDKISGSQVAHYFLVGSPLGLGPKSSGFVFDYVDSPGRQPGGNIISYSVTRPGGPTAVWVLGAGEGTDMVSYLLVDTSTIAAGYPRVTQVLSHKSVSDVETLVGYAQSAIQTGRDFLPEATVRGDSYPEIGTYQIGDYAQLRITSPEFPPMPDGRPGYVDTVRIYRRSIDPNTDAITLTFQSLDPPSNDGA